MGTFKSYSRSEIVDGRYSGRRRIYLESGDDQAIFERWFFDEGEHLEFKSCNEGSGGGCTQVIRNVQRDRENKISSFGIVDRDSLMQQQEFTLFLEKDDSILFAARPFGEYVRPLCRWEIENYLLEPNAVSTLLSDYGNYAPHGIRTEDLAAKLLLHAKALIPIMSANICLHKQGWKSLEQKFCLNEPADKINHKCLKRLKKDSFEGGFNSTKESLLEFESGDNRSERYWMLCRIVDGKRLLDRIKIEFGLKEDHRFRLASLVREHDQLAAEIKDLIREVKSENNI